MALLPNAVGIPKILLPVIEALMGMIGVYPQDLLMGVFAIRLFILLIKSLFFNLEHVKQTVKKHFSNITGLDIQVYRK